WRGAGRGPAGPGSARSPARATSSTSSSRRSWPISCSTSSRDMTPDPAWLRHNAVTLALHPLGDHSGSRPLLLLHGLGEASPTAVPDFAATWPGSVHALDFTGHGRSTVPPGGGCTAERSMGDGGTGLSALGPATVVGRGRG